MLEEADYDVVCADSGEAGFKKIEESKPDCLLLDLVLPQESGFKIAREIKSRDQHKHIPIIVVSTKREAIDKHIAAKSGAIEYLEKPVEKARLLSCLKNILI